MASLKQTREHFDHEALLRDLGTYAQMAGRCNRENFPAPTRVQYANWVRRKMVPGQWLPVLLASLGHTMPYLVEPPAEQPAEDPFA